MRSREIVPIITGTLLLLYSFSFAAFNIVKYNLGIALPWEPFEAIVNSARPTLLTGLLSQLIIAGPLLALGLFILPWIRVSFDWRQEQFLSIALYRGSRISALLIGLCLFVGGLFILYFLVENLPCLLGRQLAC